MSNPLNEIQREVFSIPFLTSILSNLVAAPLQAFILLIVIQYHNKLSHRKSVKQEKADQNIADVLVTSYNLQGNQYIQKTESLGSVDLTKIFQDVNLSKTALSCIYKAMKKCTAAQPSVFEHLSDVGANEKLIEYINSAWVNYFSGLLTPPDKAVENMAIEERLGKPLEEISYIPLLVYAKFSTGFLRPKVLMISETQTKSAYYDKIAECGFAPTNGHNRSITQIKGEELPIRFKTLCQIISHINPAMLEKLKVYKKLNPYELLPVIPKKRRYQNWSESVRRGSLQPSVPRSVRTAKLIHLN